ncbi:hypothetical protein [Halomonas sp. LBP4]|nr:hypothetical protein [Halomonas sp. LBP4]
MATIADLKSDETISKLAVRFESMELQWKYELIDNATGKMSAHPPA